MLVSGSISMDELRVVKVISWLFPTFWATETLLFVVTHDHDAYAALEAALGDHHHSYFGAWPHGTCLLVMGILTLSYLLITYRWFAFKVRARTSA